MTCAEVLSEVSAYYDGELEAAQCDVVASHLADCPKCRAYLEDLTRIGGLLRADRGHEIPDGMWARIAVAAHNSQPSRGLRVGRWLARGAGIAAGFALYLLGYGALTSAPVPHGPDQHASTAQIEQLLRDTSLALAGTGSLAEPAILFEHRPETRLLRELAKDAKP
ncbi:MAG: anti-sigma factor family protein [Planctomycetota bacterium]|jgi:anti-sigma factor RsiW